MVTFIKPLEGRKVDPYTWPVALPFPHFTPEESEVARRFIESGTLKGEWYFDVRLTSSKAEWIKRVEHPWREMWKAVTAKRIDIVCVSARAVHIIEVKRMMLSSGIGQLMTYRDMFIKEYQPDAPVVLWYVTYYHDPDVVKMCNTLGINTWYVV